MNVGAKVVFCDADGEFWDAINGILIVKATF